MTSLDPIRPIANKFCRMVGLPRPELIDLAVETWEISPAETRAVPAAICLPGQTDRIMQTEFAPREAVLDALNGQPAEHVPATMGYRLRDIDFVDGVLYSGRAEMHLRPRRKSHLHHHRPQKAVSGALYESWVGNRWFGNWLLDDCSSYRLAESFGQPVTSAPVKAGHVPRYEELLSINPTRIGDVHFDELILFDDHHNNASRIARAQDMRKRLMAGRDVAPCPGVFLYRGHSGDARILENEDEIAEKLESQYGFRVLFPEDHSVDDLVLACANAGIVAGIEGSQLTHGVAVMPPNATLLTLQPPDRATTALKSMTDRFQQRFALIVGQGRAGAFRIDWAEMQATLDLIQ
ncbi:glycosyltransferase family 61 protein [Paracoccus sp. Z330]|uniref:Glycosyltransferase family 61 protein n=1 Tax=Paracoccus onchidii TaxID=3017813 RepID=A0ABT4ZAJ9_9RHOB|nr:glycosyltransferase family 61 protein [Paracoccus onchidii]MDB6176162.1 glycosyltransferase family 61 protein [Paracoccus onchidii]